MANKTIHENATCRYPDVQWVSSYYVHLDPEIKFEDVLHPHTWINFRTHYKRHDVVRVVAYDDSFDVELAVVDVMPGGVKMRLKNKLPVQVQELVDASIEAASHFSPEIEVAPLDQDCMPVIRVNFTEETKWRLIGLKDLEIKRGFLSKADAEKEMHRYLSEIFMRQPNDEEIAAAKDAKEKKLLKRAARAS